MGLLKELWDMITVVESSMAAWRTTPWRDIHVEEMELECKRFSKDIRALDKEVREGREEEKALVRKRTPMIKVLEADLQTGWENVGVESK